jgi:uncharacterized membrane protein YecN with MAPEG domain
MFGSIKTLVSFFSVWYVCVVARRKMRVWQGNCQVRCAQQKSRGATAKGVVVEYINSASFCFAKGRGSCGSEVFGFLS